RDRRQIDALDLAVIESEGGVAAQTVHQRRLRSALTHKRNRETAPAGDFVETDRVTQQRFSLDVLRAQFGCDAGNGAGAVGNQARRTTAAIESNVRKVRISSAVCEPESERHVAEGHALEFKRTDGEIEIGVERAQTREIEPPGAPPSVDADAAAG